MPDLEEEGKHLVLGWLLEICMILATLVTMAIGIGVTAIFETQDTLKIVAWLVIFGFILPWIYGHISHYLSEWLLE